MSTAAPARKKTAPPSAKAPSSTKDPSENEPKPHFKTRSWQGAKSKREAVEVLIDQISKMNDELITIAEKLNTTQTILEAILKDSGSDDVNDMDLDEDLDYDDDAVHCVEYDGVEYYVHDTVELYDTASKKWTKKTGKIVKFCDKMARMKVGTGRKSKMTQKKYGYFRKRA